MKKIILLLFLPSLVFALENGDYLTQTELDALDFDTLPVSTFQYTIEDTQLVFNNYQYQLEKNIQFLSLSLPQYSETLNETIYYIQWQNFYLTYSDWDFFTCWLAEEDTPLNCYNTYVVPTWVNQFTYTHYIHIRVLKSYQTGGESALPGEIT